MAIQFRMVEMCHAVHPEDSILCARERGHDTEHWYTVWAPGERCEPSCWGDCEVECRTPYPSYPVFWSKECA